MRLMRSRWSAGMLLIAGWLGGCGSTMPPTGQMEGAAAAIRAAEEVGASGVPQASLHLQMAKDQSGQAQELISKGEQERGAYVLMRAQADAELAVALARANNARQAAQQAQQRVRTLTHSNP